MKCQQGFVAVAHLNFRAPKSGIQQWRQASITGRQDFLIFCREICAFFYREIRGVARVALNCWGHTSCFLNSTFPLKWPNTFYLVYKLRVLFAPRFSGVSPGLFFQLTGENTAAQEHWAGTTALLFPFVRSLGLNLKVSKETVFQQKPIRGTNHEILVW